LVRTDISHGSAIAPLPDIPLSTSVAGDKISKISSKHAKNLPNEGFTTISYKRISKRNPRKKMKCKKNNKYFNFHFTREVSPEEFLSFCNDHGITPVFMESLSRGGLRTKFASVIQRNRIIEELQHSIKLVLKTKMKFPVKVYDIPRNSIIPYTNFSRKGRVTTLHCETEDEANLYVQRGLTINEISFPAVYERRSCSYCKSFRHMDEFCTLGSTKAHEIRKSIKTKDEKSKKCSKTKELNKTEKSRDSRESFVSVIKSHTDRPKDQSYPPSEEDVLKMVDVRVKESLMVLMPIMLEAALKSLGEFKMPTSISPKISESRTIPEHVPVRKCVKVHQDYNTELVIEEADVDIDNIDVDEIDSDVTEADDFSLMEQPQVLSNHINSDVIDLWCKNNLKCHCGKGYSPNHGFMVHLTSQKVHSIEPGWISCLCGKRTDQFSKYHDFTKHTRVCESIVERISRGLPSI